MTICKKKISCGRRIKQFLTNYLNKEKPPPQMKPHQCKFHKRIYQPKIYCPQKVVDLWILGNLLNQRKYFQNIHLKGDSFPKLRNLSRTKKQGMYFDKVNYWINVSQNKTHKIFKSMWQYSKWTFDYDHSEIVLSLQLEWMMSPNPKPINAGSIWAR